MLIALATVLCGFVWGTIHGQIWLQLNVRWMALAARSLQGVRKRSNRRVEAVPPTSFTASQKFLAALFGTVVTGGILAVLASNWSFLALYPIGLFAGFSPALIQTYWRASALVGVVMLIGVTGGLLYENEGPGDPVSSGDSGSPVDSGDSGDSGDMSSSGKHGGSVDSGDSGSPVGSGEQVRVSEMAGGQELPNQDAGTQPAPPSLPPPTFVEKGEDAPEEVPEDAPEEIAHISLPSIPFSFNDQTIQSEHLTELNEAVRILNDNPNISVLIEGYSDAVGSESFNLKLSRDRAEIVREYLVEHGIAAERLRVVGRGEIDPLAPNAKDDGSDNPEGRAMNRRVELSVE